MPYQKVSEIYPDLPVQVSEVKIQATDAAPPPPLPDHRSRCGSEGRSPFPDPTPRSPPQSGQSKRRPDQATTKITTHRPKFVTTQRLGRRTPN